MIPDAVLAELPTRLLQERTALGKGRGKLTNAMLIAWSSNPDLRQAIDPGTDEGLRALGRWYRDQRYGRALRKRLLRRSAAFIRGLPNRWLEPVAGVNLVGYGQGVFGVGEHLRQTASAMRAAGVPNGIVNYRVGLGERRQPLPANVRQLRWAHYRCNLIHINADQMLRAYMSLGPDFFLGRYNIGYWAWELAQWPAQWIPTIGLVDEVWAPSRFVREALAQVTKKPVQWMPECIELPDLQRSPRSSFGVGDDEFLFLFAFDGYSFIERKNPIAAVRAFRMAFPAGDRARLIIKVMNSDVCGQGWDTLLAEAAPDERIQIIDARWPYAKLVSLMQCADAYVSLHRSEGFGRTPAEAMLLGKPVVVTNYSGTADFCRPDNALLVDYELVPVVEQSYVSSLGQVWADPSVDCAARHMRALFDDRSLGPRIGARGRQTILEEFSPTAVGHRYRGRLLELGLI